MNSLCVSPSLGVLSRGPNSLLSVFCRISNHEGHNPAGAIYRRVQDEGGLQNKWVAVCFDPVSLILIGELKSYRSRTLPTEQI